MLILGLVLLLIGVLLGIHTLYLIGLVLLILGVILFLLGYLGRPLGGRKYWY